MFEADIYKRLKKQIRDGEFDSMDAFLLHIQVQMRRAMQWEREECAKTVEKYGGSRMNAGEQALATEIAEEIRKRTPKEER